MPTSILRRSATGAMRATVAMFEDDGDQRRAERGGHVERALDLGVAKNRP